MNSEDLLFDILLPQEARVAEMYTVYNVHAIYTPTVYNKSDFSGGYKISATRQVNFLATLSKRCCASCKSSLEETLLRMNLPYNVIYTYFCYFMIYYFLFERIFQSQNVSFFYFDLNEVLNNAIAVSWLERYLSLQKFTFSIRE